MKKLFFIIAALLFVSVLFIACSLEDDKTTGNNEVPVHSADEKLTITIFIDECIDQFANNLQMGGFYGKSFILTDEQWRAVRSLFDETNWTELEDYQEPLPERSVETGFTSFFTEYATIAFLVPERIVYTIEFDESTQSVKNRYFTIDQETVELIYSKMADFYSAYEPPQSEKGG